MPVVKENGEITRVICLYKRDQARKLHENVHFSELLAIHCMPFNWRLEPNIQTAHWQQMKSTENTHQIEILLQGKCLDKSCNRFPSHPMLSSGLKIVNSC